MAYFSDSYDQQAQAVLTAARPPHWALIEVTAPATEPVALDEAKLYLRITEDADNAMVLLALKAARRYAEERCNLTLVTTTHKLLLDEFPEDDGTIVMPRPPLQSITHVKYYDAAGTLQTLAASKYRVDASSMPGRIDPAYGESWPDTRDQSGAVELQFLAGYGAIAVVPENAKLAVLKATQVFYDERGVLSTSAAASAVTAQKFGLESLLAQISMARVA